MVTSIFPQKTFLLKNFSLLKLTWDLSIILIVFELSIVSLRNRFLVNSADGHPKYAPLVLIER